MSDNPLSAEISALTLQRQRDFVASLVMLDNIYLPVFQRLDRECHLTGTAMVDPVAAARYLSQRPA